MKKQQPRRLSVKKETLRQLRPGDLGQVAGGMWRPPDEPDDPRGAKATARCRGFE